MSETTEEVRRLRDALAPFARFAEQWNRNPLRGIDDVLYAIHAGADRAEIRLSDCRRALAALRPSSPDTDTREEER
jgi:hypothetical protein